MFGILSLVIGPLATLGGKIADLVVARQQAKTEVEKALIDEQIKQVESIKDVLVAEATSPIASVINSSLRALAAVGPITYVTKIFLWDKVVGAFYGCAGQNTEVCRTLFNTDPLIDTNLNWVLIAVIGFYFVTTIRK
jgi:hypothetical protein